MCLPFYLPPAKNLAYGKQSFEDESAHNYYDEAVAWGSSYPTGGEDPAITDSDDDNDEGHSISQFLSWHTMLLCSLQYMYSTLHRLDASDHLFRLLRAGGVNPDFDLLYPSFDSTLTALEYKWLKRQ